MGTAILILICIIIAVAGAWDCTRSRQRRGHLPEDIQ